MYPLVEEFLLVWTWTVQDHLVMWLVVLLEAINAAGQESHLSAVRVDPACEENLPRCLSREDTCWMLIRPCGPIRKIRTMRVFLLHTSIFFFILCIYTLANEKDFLQTFTITVIDSAHCANFVRRGGVLLHHYYLLS